MYNQCCPLKHVGLTISVDADNFAGIINSIRMSIIGPWIIYNSISSIVFQKAHPSLIFSDTDILFQIVDAVNIPITRTEGESKGVYLELVFKNVSEAEVHYNSQQFDHYY